MSRIYMSQALVDHWLSTGRIHLQGDLLHMEVGGQPMSLHIHPAVYFERVDGAEDDPYQIVGCVKTSEELAQIGAEHYDTSVLMGEHAYTVRPGFLASPAGAHAGEPPNEALRWAALLGTFDALASA